MLFAFIGGFIFMFYLFPYILGIGLLIWAVCALFEILSVPFGFLLWLNEIPFNYLIGIIVAFMACVAIEKWNLSLNRNK